MPSVLPEGDPAPEDGSLPASALAGLGTGLPSSAITLKRWPGSASVIFSVGLALSNRNNTRSPSRTRTGSP